MPPEPRPSAALPYLGALHALLAILTLHYAILPHSDAVFTLTLRRQFYGWHDLLGLYRDTAWYVPALPNGTRPALPLADALLRGEEMRDEALRSAWCLEYLPPGAVRAPYCGCLSRKHDAYLNASGDAVASGGTVPQAARDGAVKGLVSCLGSRPVWRLQPVWGTHVGAPCLYLLVVAACFLCAASDLSDSTVRLGVWAISIYTGGVLLLGAHSAMHALWSLSLVAVAALIHWVILPGLVPQPDSEAEQPLLNAPGDHAQMPRGASCFWWAEYLSAPVFAFYAAAVHGGRDLVHVVIVVTLGAAVGGLALRSFWCGQAYPDAGGKGQMRPILQRVVWLGILGAAAGLLALQAVYYRDGLPLRLGIGSVALLCATLLVSIIQYPGAEAAGALPVQFALALARNVALFALVFLDARRIADGL